ncbi:MAG: peptidoglycan editing factor PgeF [Prevotella sp.]|nr:peptidoglycan editing factor PgeF [Prevotella sp.]
MRPRLTRYPVYGTNGGVEVFSTTRHGGVSVGNHGTFNINGYCGDLPENILTNKKLLADELGIDVQHIIMPHQTHGTVARCIDADFLNKSEEERRLLLEGVDAVFTDLPCICVGVSTADCIPVLLYDPLQGVVAAVHAGWRGTVARIAGKTIKAMAEAFGCASNDMVAWIGPGISIDAFEVGDEVYDTFVDAGFDMQGIAQRFPAADSMAADGCKWHVDLVECNRRQLVEAGVDEHSIYVSGICTFNNCTDYFSARRLGINSGRIYSGILLK